MSYTFAGSGAGSISAYVSTQSALAENLGADGDGDTPVLVLEDRGNQLAYVIEGTVEEIADLITRMESLIPLMLAHRIADEAELDAQGSTWVVFNAETGQSTEDMRYATKREARDWINSRTMPWNFGMRREP